MVEAPEQAGAGRRTANGVLRAHAPWLAVLNVAAVAVIGNFLNPHLKDFGGDNVHFLLLAEALAKGLGYVNVHLPGAPVHAHYPPLYPALLAPFVAFGAPLVVLKAWTALLSLAGLNLAYAVLVPVRGRTIALLAVLGTLLSQSFLDCGIDCMSDGPYLLFSMAALLFVRRAFAAEGRWVRPAVLAGVFTGLAVLARTVGIVFGPAIALFALVAPAPRLGVRDRVRRLVVVGAVTFVVASPWLATLAFKGTTRFSYVAELTNTTQAPGGAQSGLLDRPLANLKFFADSIADTDLAPVAGAVYLALFGVVALVVVAGLARGFARRRDVETLYVAFYLVVLLLWVPGGFRLLMPLFPLLLAALPDGVGLFAGRARAAAPPRWLHVAAVSGLATVLLFEALTIQFVPLVNERLRAHDATWWREYLRTVCTVGTIAAPDETMISEPDAVPYYLAGIRSARMRGRRADLHKAILDSGARYVVLSPNQRYRFGNAFEDAVRNDPARFRPLTRFGSVEAFAVVDASAPPDWTPKVSPRPFSARCAALVPNE